MYTHSLLFGPKYFEISHYNVLQRIYARGCQNRYLGFAHAEPLTPTVNVAPRYDMRQSCMHQVKLRIYGATLFKFSTSVILFHPELDFQISADKFMTFSKLYCWRKRGCWMLKFSNILIDKKI